MCIERKWISKEKAKEMFPDKNELECECKMSDFLYKPPQTVKLHEEPKMYVKFSRNITILESYLKDNNVEYSQENLEDTPLGKGYVIRRD
jgi:hypothetical protein